MAQEKFTIATGFAGLVEHLPPAQRQTLVVEVERLVRDFTQLSWEAAQLLEVSAI